MKFTTGSLSDIKTFNYKEGLTYIDTAGREKNVEEIKTYLGERAQAGRIVSGFPKTNKFSNS